MRITSLVSVNYSPTTQFPKFASPNFYVYNLCSVNNATLYLIPVSYVYVYSYVLMYVY